MKINAHIIKACNETSKLHISTSNIKTNQVTSWADDLPPEMIDLQETVIPEVYYTKTMRDLIYYWSETPKILFELYYV